MIWSALTLAVTSGPWELHTGLHLTPFHAATPPERMQAMRAAIPMGRLGVPADCVGAFLFLASRELSGYVTGQVIHVNGGQAMP